VSWLPTAVCDFKGIGGGTHWNVGAAGLALFFDSRRRTTNCPVADRCSVSD